MGVKQSCPLSATLFGLYIDELEELTTKYTESKEIEGPTIGMCTLLILLYADGVIMMTHSCASMNKLLKLFTAFCDKNEMTVNVTKIKMMICSRGTKESFTYNGQSIETVTNFKYLGIEIPSTYKWSKCMDRRLAAAKKMYYMFKTICSHKDINSWKVRCILFEA